LGEGVGATGVLVIGEERRRVKAADDARDLAVVIGQHRIIDPGNTAFSGNKIIPEGLQIVSNRRDDSHSGNYDASFHV